MKTLTLEEWKNLPLKKKHKFNAKRSESNGIKFSSKLEKQYYERLLIAKEEGKLNYFLMQVPFKLPGNTKYVVDFMVISSCNPDYIEYIDVKGVMTPMSILKIKQVEALYPIKIKIVDERYMKNHQI